MTTNMLISNKERFWVSLLRMYNNGNDGVMFESKDQTFNILVRVDPDGSAGRYVMFDVAIATEDDDPVLTKIIDLAVGGYVDDETGDYVVDSWEFDRNEPDMDEVDEMIDLVNKLYEYRFCHCGKQFIKDSKDLCVFCEMSATDADLETFECPICLDTGYVMHSKTMSCCSNKIHQTCNRRWSLEGNNKCVICRSSFQSSRPDIDELIRTNISEAVDRQLISDTC